MLLGVSEWELSLVETDRVLGNVVSSWTSRDPCNTSVKGGRQCENGYWGKLASAAALMHFLILNFNNLKMSPQGNPLVLWNWDSLDAVSCVNEYCLKLALSARAVMSPCPLHALPRLCWEQKTAVRSHLAVSRNGQWHSPFWTLWHPEISRWFIFSSGM